MIKKNDLAYLRLISEQAKSGLDPRATITFRRVVTPARLLTLLDEIEKPPPTTTRPRRRRD